MILDKHNWVCSVCGQGLTRKSTANRHNNNLHLGDAMLVRPYEYLIGRLNGKFLQSDPSLYRHSNGSQKDVSGSIYHDYGDNNRKGFVPGNIVHERGYEYVREKPTKSNDVKSTFYAQFDPALQPSHKLVDVKASDTIEKLSERMLKLKEIEILANKHYLPHIAEHIIIRARAQANIRDDDFLDKNLAYLRNMDRAKSGSY